MLAIRFLRQGRKNSAFFRVVLTESSRPPKSGFLKVLGWYNPHTKEVKLDKDQIIAALDNGAQASNSVARLLSNNGIKHKNATFVADAPKSKKGKDEEPKKPAAPAAEAEASAEEAAESPEAANEEAPAEEPVAEETPAE